MRAEERKLGAVGFELGLQVGEPRGVPCCLLLEQGGASLVQAVDLGL